MHFLDLSLEKDTVSMHFAGQKKKKTSYELILLWLDMPASRSSFQCLLSAKWWSLKRLLKRQEVDVGWRSRKWAFEA